jgi:penicillin-binding protein 1C
MALKKYLRFGILAVLIGWLALRLVPAPALTASAIGSKALFDKDGALLSLSLSADDKYRLFHSFKEISPSLVRATLLYEDAHFFSHPGVNPF